MTSRTVLITDRAQALNRIESALPEKFVSTLPGKSDERMNAILNYVAAALEKKSGAKPPPAEPTPEPEPEPAKA